VNGIRIRLRRLVLGQLGAVATEYGLILTFVAIAIVVAVGFFGDELASLFQSGPDTIPSP